jgi:hypothetical protein
MNTVDRALTRREIAELCQCDQKEIPSSPLYQLTMYEAPGPVASRYINSKGPIDLITGPQGSGKTVASIFKFLQYSMETMPVCIDNRLRVRGTVLRDNYRALYRTTLRSWFEFFPPNYGGAEFFGGQDRPARHVLKLSTVRAVAGSLREIQVDLEIDFFAVGDVAIEELLKGYETSWVWCNEADLLLPRVITFAYGRTGRYPKLDRLPPGTPRPRVVGGDFNPPSPRHPLWQAVNRGSFQKEDSEEIDGVPGVETKKTINFFHQPSGLSPDAENRKGKTYEAYLEEAQTLPEEDVRRFVHGLPGFASDGKPVYARQFNRRKHVAACAPGTLAVLPNLPLKIGLDQDLSPGAVIFQTSPHGQFRLYAELVPGHGVGVARFCELLVLTLMQPRFRGRPISNAWADPAGFYGADKEAGELAWAMAVSKALNLAVYPAPSNEPEIRWEAVRFLLRTDIDANTPAFIADPCCEIIIEGFEAEYKFPKYKQGAPQEFGERAVKNLHANGHDALQYGALGDRGHMGTINEAARAGRAGNIVALGSARHPAEKPGDFSVWKV